MNQQQKGFTLIELILVIVVLGILAVVAMPKFVDLSGDAQTSAVNGVAGALSSAATVNYAARKSNVLRGVPIANCTDEANALAGGMPTGYTITAAVVAVDTTVSCTLTGPGPTTANFVAIGVS